MLRCLPWNEVEEELSASKKVLEDKLGKNVESFSYPFAFPEEDRRFQTRLRASLVQVGYKNGVTTRIGTNAEGDDHFFFKRIPVNSEDDPAFFLAKLESGYDWVNNLQHGYKILRCYLGSNRTGGR